MPQYISGPNLFTVGRNRRLKGMPFILSESRAIALLFKKGTAADRKDQNEKNNY